MVVILALLSAGSSAASAVLQRVAAASAPPSTSMHVSLLGYLLHRRIWLAGLAALIAGFLLQAGALDRGALSVVQPLLVAKLPITLLVAVLVLGGRGCMGARDWFALIAMPSGLALVLGVSAPSSSSQTPSSAAWLTTVVAAAVVAAVLVRLAGRHPGPARAALLGAGSGMAFGLTAALIKGLTDTLDGGLVGLVLSWFPYAIAAAGMLALLLQQSALQAGSLLASQPASMIVGTVISVLLGVVLFGEHVQISGVWPAELLGIGVVVAAVFLTVHSPLLAASTVEPPPAAPATPVSAPRGADGRTDAGPAGGRRRSAPCREGSAELEPPACCPHQPTDAATCWSPRMASAADETSSPEPCCASTAASSPASTR